MVVKCSEGKKQYSLSMENNKGDLLGESGYSSSGKIEKKETPFYFNNNAFSKVSPKSTSSMWSNPFRKIL